jgi:type IV pilus assembly protein PilB
VPIEAYEQVGCVRCNGSGFRGRVGVYEVMRVSEAIRSLILDRASGAEIAAAATGDGMRRMPADGLEKVRRGLTSVAEVLRVLDA